MESNNYKGTFVTATFGSTNAFRSCCLLLLSIETKFLHPLVPTSSQLSVSYSPSSGSIFFGPCCSLNSGTWVHDLRRFPRDTCTVQYHLYPHAKSLSAFVAYNLSCLMHSPASEEVTTPSISFSHITAVVSLKAQTMVATYSSFSTHALNSVCSTICMHTKLRAQKQGFYTI